MAKIGHKDQCSSGFGESDDISVLSETFSAQQKIIFADETDLTFASSALATVLSEFTGVSSPEKIGHVVKIKLIFILIFNSYYLTH
jgi:hypothetical protein